MTSPASAHPTAVTPPTHVSAAGAGVLASVLLVLALVLGPQVSVSAEDDGAVAEQVGALPTWATQPAVPADGAGDLPDLATTPALHPAATSAGPVAAALDAAARTHGIDQNLLRAVAWTESSFRPGATSHAGAVGIMQLMPDTLAHAEELLGRELHPTNVIDNAEAGAAYLVHLLDLADGDVALALAAYHQGWTGVARDGISDASRGYVRTVLDLRDALAATA